MEVIRSKYDRPVGLLDWIRKTANPQHPSTVTICQLRRIHLPHPRPVLNRPTFKLGWNRIFVPSTPTSTPPGAYNMTPSTMPVLNRPASPSPPRPRDLFSRTS